jgi:hypothetical protein
VTVPNLYHFHILQRAKHRELPPYTEEVALFSHKEELNYVICRKKDRIGDYQVK